MKVLIAPDKFKGSLTAREAADAIARGVIAAAPDADVAVCPLADGGEGTLHTLVTATGGRVETLDVCGPRPGQRVRAPLGWLGGADDESDTRTAVVELASASGLQLLAPEHRDPTRTTTFGTGELVAEAVRRGARRVIVGVGGSATCDGGLGIAQACGAALRLRSGKTYAAGDRKITGADAGRVVSLSRRVDGPAGDKVAGLLRFAGVEIVVAADVGNPLLGPDGAAAVFAPQKGALPAQVRSLEAGLTALVDRFGLEAFATAPAAGAGGGAAFGLMAYFGATAVSGANLVFDHLRLADRLRDVDLCLTGEGRFDAQSLGGKAPVALAGACRAAGVPCVVIAGSLGGGWQTAHEAGVTAAFSILDRPTALVDAQDEAAALLARSAEQIARLWAAGRRASHRGRSGRP